MRTAFRPRSYVRGLYVFENPFRGFVMVNVPSGCADTLIQYAGEWSALPRPPAGYGLAAGAAPLAGGALPRGAGGPSALVAGLGGFDTTALN